MKRKTVKEIIHNILWDGITMGKAFQKNDPATHISAELIENIESRALADLDRIVQEVIGEDIELDEYDDITESGRLKCDWQLGYNIRGAEIRKRWQALKDGER